jgi:hypothetical protein
MGLCEACGKGIGTCHVTLRVEVFGPKSTRLKVVQFMLCDVCELASQQVLANDPQQRQRVALRMSQDPEFLSRWRDWRNRRRSQVLPARPPGS